MKKLALLSLLVVVLPYISMAQSVDDDLYFVPKSKKEKKETTVTRTERVTTVTSTKTSKTILDDTPQEVRFTSSGRFASPDVVLDAAGVERDVDAYNRRYSFSVDTATTTRYVVETEEVVEKDSEWTGDFASSEGDYQYATRLIRFRSPRVAVPVSSPLYWDLAYTWSPYDWDVVYTDGYYAYVTPAWSNPYWWDWHYDPWRWHSGWSWHVGWGTGGWHFGFGWGWHAPWHHHHYPYHAPYWGHHHHPHHGPHFGGGHVGGWRNGFYYDNRRRIGNRPAVRAQRQEVASVRASRENDRGSSVATRTSSGRTATGRASDSAVRSNSTRGSQTENVATTTNRGRNSRSAVGRNSNQTSTSTRQSQATTNRNSESNVRSNSGRSSRSSSSYSTENSSRSSSRSSSGNYSRSSSSTRSSSGSYSSGRSSSSRSSSAAGGSTRSSGGGRSGGRR